MNAKPTWREMAVVYGLQVIVPAGIASFWGIREAILWGLAGAVSTFLTDSEYWYLLLWHWNVNWQARIFIRTLGIEVLALVLMRISLGFFAAGLHL